MALRTEAGGGRGFYYGWTIVYVTFYTIFVVSAVSFSFGIFFKPLIAEFNWSRSLVSFAVSLNMIVYGLVQAFIGRAIDRWGSRAVVSASVMILGAGALLVSTAQNPWQLYIYYGLIVAIGYGGSGVVTGQVIVSKWFAKRLGTALSISMAGFSLGQILLVPATMYLIINFGWRSTYTMLGLFALASALPLNLIFMKRSPAQLGLMPDGEPMGRGAPGHGMGEDVRAIGLLEAMGTRHFWLIAEGFFVCGFTISLVYAHLPIFAIDIGVGAIPAASALGLINAVSIIGVMATGLASDKVGRRAPLGLCYFLRGLSFLLLLTVSNSFMLYIFTILFGLTFTATVPLVSSYIDNLYGKKSVGDVFGGINLIHQVGAMIGPFFAGYIFDLQRSYFLAFFISAILCFTAAFCTFAIKAKRPHELGLKLAFTEAEDAMAKLDLK